MATGDETKKAAGERVRGMVAEEMRRRDLLGEKKPAQIKLTGKVHMLKTLPEFFAAVKRNEKTFEVRNNDRGYVVGDELLLAEWDDERKEYTGAEVRRVVSYVLDADNFMMSPGYVVLGFALNRGHFFRTR